MQDVQAAVEALMLERRGEQQVTKHQVTEQQMTKQQVTKQIVRIVRQRVETQN